MNIIEIKNNIDKSDFISNIQEFFNSNNKELGDVYKAYLKEYDKNEDEEELKEMSKEDFHNYILLIDELVAYIISHNQKLIRDLQKKISGTTQTKSGLNREEILIESFSHNEILVDSSNNEEYQFNKENEKEIISIVNRLINSDENIEALINMIKKEYITAVKISLICQKKLLKNKIIELLSEDPLHDIRNYQERILKIDYILIELNDKEEIISEQQELDDTIKLIILPKDISTSYLLEDIKNYSSRYDIITNALKKLYSKLKFKTSGLRSINSIEKLYEYRETNGLRILFFSPGENIFIITSLFFKDQQRSIKINNVYLLAKTRFESYNQDAYDEYLKNQDFQIEAINNELKTDSIILRRRKES